MTTFQRARSEDQREIRRRESLDTVASTLGETRPSAGVLAAAGVGPSPLEHPIDFEKSLETLVATPISVTLARMENRR